MTRAGTLVGSQKGQGAGERHPRPTSQLLRHRELACGSIQAVGAAWRTTVLGAARPLTQGLCLPTPGTLGRWKVTKFSCVLGAA